jgi:hypothetical protein
MGRYGVDFNYIKNLLSNRKYEYITNILWVTDRGMGKLGSCMTNMMQCFCLMMPMLMMIGTGM